MVMSKLNGWEGALAVVSDDFEGSYVSPEYPVFKVDELSADLRYITHLIAWPELWSRLTPRGSMVRRKRITPATLLAARAPLPPLPEQQRIASRLESALSKIGRINDAHRRVKELGASVKDSLLSRIEERSPLGTCLDIARGAEQIFPNREYDIAGIYSFGRGLIRRPPIKGSETSYATMTRLSAGQVIMSKLNAWEGAIAVVPKEFSNSYVSPEYPVFNIDHEKIAPSYLVHIMTWPKFWEGLTPRGSMVRRKRTTPAVLLGTIVPMPDLAEQQCIAEKLGAISDYLAATVVQEACVQELRSELLYSAFSGQL
jgi:type I restriction enzyme S subunit